MTPKEKADFLYKNFLNKNTVWVDDENYYTSPKKTRECVLILIDEIISENKLFPYNTIFYERLEFWEKVKQEIEKI